MITFTIIKAFFSKILTFCIENYRVVAFCLLLALTYYYKSSYDAVTADYATFKANLATLADKHKSEIEIINKAAKIQHENTHKAYEAEVARLKLDRSKIAKDLQDEKNNITDLLNRAYELRVISASGYGVSKVSTPSELSPDRGDYDAIITITESAKQCAIDYNTLMQSWLDDCKFYGCE